MKTYRFNASISGNVVFSDGPKPLFDEYENLIGAFNLQHGNTVIGFLSGSGYEAALQVSTGETFFFTPKENSAGEVVSAIISPIPTSVRQSVAVTSQPSTEIADAQR